MAPSSLLLLLIIVPYASAFLGLNFISDWLRGIGISYVAPMPRQGTCRDCSRSNLVGLMLD